jgi:hypothetical protein
MKELSVICKINLLNLNSVASYSTSSAAVRTGIFSGTGAALSVNFTRSLAGLAASKCDSTERRLLNQKKKNCMKVATIIVRSLLGLMFTVFGLNIFFDFMPMPSPPEGPARNFTMALAVSHYFYVIGALEVAGGALLLAGRFGAARLDAAWTGNCEHSLRPRLPRTVGITDGDCGFGPRAVPALALPRTFRRACEERSERAESGSQQVLASTRFLGVVVSALMLGFAAAARARNCLLNWSVTSIARHPQ